MKTPQAEWRTGRRSIKLPDLAANVWKRVWEHDVLGRAAQLAYFFRDA